MSLVDLVPVQYRVAATAVGVALLFVLAGSALYGAYHFGHGLGLDEGKLQYAQEAQRQAEAKAQAEADARDEEQRRIKSNQLVATNAQDLQTQATADAAGAGTSAGGVQLAASVLAARPSSCAGNPAAATGSPPANHAAMVLSDLLTRADKRAADLASLADKSRIAGLACEAAYDGLIPK